MKASTKFSLSIKLCLHILSHFLSTSQCLSLRTRLLIFESSVGFQPSSIFEHRCWTLLCIFVIKIPTLWHFIVGTDLSGRSHHHSTVLSYVETRIKFLMLLILFSSCLPSVRQPSGCPPLHYLVECLSSFDAVVGGAIRRLIEDVKCFHIRHPIAFYGLDQEILLKLRRSLCSLYLCSVGHSDCPIYYLRLVHRITVLLAFLVTGLRASLR